MGWGKGRRIIWESLFMATRTILKMLFFPARRPPSFPPPASFLLSALLKHKNASPLFFLQLPISRKHTFY